MRAPSRLGGARRGRVDSGYGVARRSWLQMQWYVVIWGGITVGGCGVGERRIGVGGDGIKINW